MRPQKLIQQKTCWPQANYTSNTQFPTLLPAVSRDSTTFRSSRSAYKVNVILDRVLAIIDQSSIFRTGLTHHVSGHFGSLFWAQPPANVPTLTTATDFSFWDFQVLGSCKHICSFTLLRAFSEWRGPDRCRLPSWQENAEKAHFNVFWKRYCSTL